jgi:hypothetical protein
LRTVQKYIELASEDKNFWGRSLILLWTLCVLRFISHNQDIRGLYNPLWVVSHGIHEIGHWVTMPFGMWISVASGSLFQFLFPFVFIIAMVRSYDLHGAFVLFTWQAASLMNMAHYAGSAEYSDLVLSTPHYITLYHDWVWMLSHLDAIDSARSVENFFYFLAWCSGLFSLFGQSVCLWFIWQRKDQVS